MNSFFSWFPELEKAEKWIHIFGYLAVTFFVLKIIELCANGLKAVSHIFIKIMKVVYTCSKFCYNSVKWIMSYFYKKKQPESLMALSEDYSVSDTGSEILAGSRDMVSRSSRKDFILEGVAQPRHPGSPLRAILMRSFRFYAYDTFRYINEQCRMIGCRLEHVSMLTGAALQSLLFYREMAILMTITPIEEHYLIPEMAYTICARLTSDDPWLDESYELVGLDLNHLPLHFLSGALELPDDFDTSTLEVRVFFKSQFYLRQNISELMYSIGNMPGAECFSVQMYPIQTYLGEHIEEPQSDYVFRRSYKKLTEHRLASTDCNSLGMHGVHLNLLHEMTESPLCNARIYGQLGQTLTKWKASPNITPGLDDWLDKNVDY